MGCAKPIIGGQETLCIRVPKVFDWVTRQVDVFRNSFTFNSSGDDPCSQLVGDLTVECLPVSPNGSRFIDPTSREALLRGDIICEEIPQPGGRQSVTVTIGNQPVTLQKVKVLKKGFVRVRVTGSAVNGTNNSFLSDVIEWSIAEKFFLCAPEGTEVVCHITDFECDATIICTTPPTGPSEFQQLDVSINLCQDIQMEADVKLEVEGVLCAPREDFAVPCPPRAFPPQCPTVFPG